MSSTMFIFLKKMKERSANKISIAGEQKPYHSPQTCILTYRHSLPFKYETVIDSLKKKLHFPMSKNTQSP